MSTDNRAKPSDFWRYLQSMYDESPLGPGGFLEPGSWHSSDLHGSIYDHNGGGLPDPYTSLGDRLQKEGERYDLPYVGPLQPIGSLLSGFGNLVNGKGYRGQPPEYQTPNFAFEKIGSGLGASIVPVEAPAPAPAPKDDTDGSYTFPVYGPEDQIMANIEERPKPYGPDGSFPEYSPEEQIMLANIEERPSPEEVPTTPARGGRSSLRSGRMRRFLPRTIGDVGRFASEASKLMNTLQGDSQGMLNGERLRLEAGRYQAKLAEDQRALEAEETTMARRIVGEGRIMDFNPQQVAMLKRTLRTQVGRSFDHLKQLANVDLKTLELRKQEAEAYLDTALDPTIDPRYRSVFQSTRNGVEVLSNRLRDVMNGWTLDNVGQTQRAENRLTDLRSTPQGL